ncbi:MAG: hypothetical protein KJ964_11450 [Verrucomicrobia bacterium]|nr:hypothetical protein [Verrucomicrobiota bacterium]MBU1734376.1 hypothetical protein [Verrucomicrobiota bacterium]MBU1857551.1 hypothetical protein [Verrucomicrobiota bacterium]
MKITAGLSLLSAGALVFLFSVSDVSAQARRVTPRATGTGASVQPGAAVAGKEGAVIRKMEATGPTAKVRTPEIKNDSNEPQAQSRDWARITVQYETDVEWTDELEFRYMVLVKNPKTRVFTMFPASVTYIDVPKGKRHTSTVFLRPNTLERYGAVEWAGVKIYLKGKDTPVDVAQMPDDQRPWTISYPTMPGVLLNRDQTPFALVAIDNYETIKPK